MPSPIPVTPLRGFGAGPVVGRVSTLLLALMVGLAVVGSAGRAAASVPTGPAPIACRTPTVFVAAGQPTVLYAQTRSASASTFTPLGTADGVYNALAYNAADRMLYAVQTLAGVSHLVVVDGHGALTDLGPLTGISVADMGSRIIAGAFDTAGHYWVAAGATTGSGDVYRVDVRARTATRLDTSATVHSLDLTYAQGYLWGIRNGTRAVQRIDVRTGAVTDFVVPSVPAGPYGAAWTYGNGDLGFDINTGGVFVLHVTHPASASPDFTLVTSSSGPSSNNNDGTSCVPGPVDLQVVTRGPATVAPGGPVRWTVTVRNLGPNPGSGFRVIDAVPPGYTGIATTIPGCTVTARSLSCAGGELAVGAIMSMVITAHAPPSAGCLTNRASVRGNEVDPLSSNDTAAVTTCVTSSPAITLTKSVTLTHDGNHDGLAGVADRLTYTFTVRNTGDVSLASVAVSDPALAGATPAVPVSCPHTTLTPGGRMLCTSGAYPVTQADVDARAVRNSARAIGRPPTGRWVVSAPSRTTTHTPGAGIRVTQSAELHERDGDSVADPGEGISYRFVVTNTGAVTLRGSLVDDERLTRLGLVVLCPTATLAPGASMVCRTASYRVRQADVDRGLVPNVVTTTTTAMLTATATGAMDAAPGSLGISAVGFPGSPALGSRRQHSSFAVDTGGEGARSQRALAFTGPTSDGLAPVGLGLLVLGLLLTAGARRRRREAD
ncbi:DUF11 domain-containing protein [Pedococcus sp. 5OH_020]|uniref:DUF11 domain-containing protein n=1 Tax=Pedococcus sp. 5OH_020 TaxID=2989814 RepID=UPI0022E9F856|nr:DUF11 domain-containing protein [Pedococcus sp. 5OH_020]